MPSGAGNVLPSPRRQITSHPASFSAWERIEPISPVAKFVIRRTESIGAEAGPQVTTASGLDEWIEDASIKL
jgi:hypothetical protein